MKKVLVIPGAFVPSNDTVTLLTYKHLRLLDYQFDVCALKRKEDKTIIKDLEKDPNYQKFTIKYLANYDDIIMNMDNKKVISGMRKMFKYIDDCIKVFEEGDYETIYTSSIPCFTHLVGHRIKKKYPHVKWIASFSDPIYKSPYKVDKETIKEYSLIEKMGFFFYINTYMNSNFEKVAMANADKLIFISENQKNFMLNNYKIDYSNKSFVIPLNYIKDWNIYSNLLEKSHQINAKITMVHMGRIYGLRKIDSFLIALANLDQDILAKIEVHNYGFIQGRYLKMIKELGLEKVFLIKDYVPYEEAMQKLKDADVLLIFDTIMDGEIQPYLPSKILEYLILDKPILAVSQANSPVYELLKENDYVSNKTATLRKMIEKLVNNYHLVSHNAVENKEIKEVMTEIFEG